MVADGLQDDGRACESDRLAAALGHRPGGGDPQERPAARRPHRAADRPHHGGLEDLLGSPTRRQAGRGARCCQPEILRDIESMIALLDRRIEKLDREIAALIGKSTSLTEKARLLAPVPGIGPTVLATLLGELPELGSLCQRRIASLAGLAPHARESGTWRGSRRIWGGRRKVREALYIAALTATRRIPSLVALRQRMRAAGKAPKTILIAAGRQLLVILNAMIRTGQPIRL